MILIVAGLLAPAALFVALVFLPPGQPATLGLFVSGLGLLGAVIWLGVAAPPGLDAAVRRQLDIPQSSIGPPDQQAAFLLVVPWLVAWCGGLTLQTLRPRILAVGGHSTYRNYAAAGLGIAVVLLLRAFLS